MITNQILLLYFSVAALSIMIQVSELSYRIKKLVGFFNPNIKKLQSPLFYTRLLGSTTSLILSPFLFLIMGIVYIHQYIKDLVSCPYCTSFWLATLGTYFLFDIPILFSLIYAPIAIGITIILNYFFVNE